MRIAGMVTIHQWLLSPLETKVQIIIIVKTPHR